MCLLLYKMHFSLQKKASDGFLDDAYNQGTSTRERYSQVMRESTCILDGSFSKPSITAMLAVSALHNMHSLHLHYAACWTMAFLHQSRSCNRFIVIIEPFLEYKSQGVS